MISPTKAAAHALRSLVHAKAFALTAILTLALGIGLSTAVFTVASTLFLRPLPVTDQSRIAVLWGEQKTKTFNTPLSLADATDFARRTRTFSQVAFAAYEGAQPQAILEDGRVTRLRRALVAGNFFSVLGVKPALGRAFGDADDAYGGAPAIVLSYRAWQQHFGADPNIADRKIVAYANGVAYRIVGVAPQGLDYPRGTEFWAPIQASTPAAALPAVSVYVVGRMRAMATIAIAQAELTAFLQRPEAPAALRTERGVATVLPSLILGDTKTAMVVFAIASALLLVLACINVANLLLIRGLARRREIAVRSALGASRSQVVGQLLTENIVLAVLGGALGVLVAAGAVKGFVSFAPAGVPRLDEIHLSLTALGGAAAISAVAMLMFAIAPAVMASRVELQQTLRSDARQAGNRRSRLAAEVLVVGQIALALLVLSAAGLIARSFIRLQSAELAFEPAHLLVAELALENDQFGSKDKQLAMLARVSAQLAAVPGLRGSSPVVAAPFAVGWTGHLTAEGQSADQDAANPWLNMEVVSPDYFTTIGTPVLRGRAFTDQDRENSPVSFIVSQSTARYYWPNEDPIGKHIRLGTKLGGTVVGVVSDTRYRDLREARPSIYMALRQDPFSFTPTSLVIRTDGPPAERVAAIRQAIAESGTGVALASAAPFDTYMEGPLAQPRLNALLLAVFAAAAALLAGVGLFGVMATMVRQRTRELGVRMALGATSGNVHRMILRRGLGIAAVGTAIGLIGALSVNRLLTAMLYDVSPADGLTLGAVAALLLAVAGVASFIPARASTRIDPVIVLRAEG